KLKMNGIEVALCSNSPSSRGKNFGKHLPVSNTYPFSCKPFPFCFKKAMRDHGLKANQIAILGDQMYTDILGGNIWGLYTILTAPIAIKDRNITKVFRFFEELIYGYLEKKKLLKRGDFDD
ncbi:YqeG family HAD IIIA-type phosphatase, partial [Holdemanella porci]